MRKTILTAPCLLLSLLSAVGVCSGKFGTPITDDVSRLSLLKQNIPSDYEIPVNYIPKEVSGMCWVVLNIYPLEQSLKRLANMFGAISHNKDNIIVFITMLKSLRFTFNHEELETAMQVFRCHYRQGNLLSGLYFDYVKELLNTAAQGVEGFPCKPPPCHHSHNTPGGLEEDAHSWSNKSAWFLLVIPVTACVVLVLWLVIIRRRRAPVFDIESGRAVPRDTVPTVSANVSPADCTSVPLHVLSCSSAANALPTGQRGSSATVTEHKRIQTYDERRMKGNSAQH